MEHDRHLAALYQRGMLSEWLRNSLETAGIGQSELARQLTLALGRSIDRAAVNKMVSGERKIAADELLAAARILHAPPPLDENMRLRMVTVAAHVQAGEWAEHWEWPPEDQYQVAVPADPMLDGFRLYGAETRGPSMNRKYPERTVIVFTNIIETDESPAPGKRYVVERIRPDGQLEHTVKLLHQDSEGKYWLLPESTDPLFQQPIAVDDGDGAEVRIVGRVHYAVSRE